MNRILIKTTHLPYPFIIQLVYILMRFYIRGIILLLLLNVVLFQNTSYAQKSFSNHFLGMNPGISIKPFYKSGEMDMNIIPLVYQTTLYGPLDIRLISIMNFGFRKEGNEIINYGMELALPYVFGQRNEGLQLSQGFYVAPVISLLRYNELKTFNTSVLIEPGIMFRVEEKASVIIGLQLGAGYYDLQELNNKWQNHIGLKIILGNWF